MMHFKTFMRRLPYLALGIGLLSANGSESASAAEFTERPDLLERLNSLKRIYPAQGPYSVVGLRQSGNEAVSPDDDTGSARVIAMSGVIEAGDAAKFQAALDAIGFHPLKLVFDSPGGNFVESFKIADIIRGNIESQDPTMGEVYVLNGEQCMSACAIAFALSVDLAHPDVNDRRFVERGAQLGFHMASVPPEKAKELAEIGQVLELSYDVTAQFNNLLIGGANPPELLREAVKHRTPDSFYVLRGDLETWKMGFSPVSDNLNSKRIGRFAMDESTVGRICQTYLTNSRIYRSGAADEFSFFGGEGPPEVSIFDHSSATDSWFSASSPSGFACGVHFTADNQVRLALWRGAPACKSGGDEFGWCAATPTRSEAITAGFLADVARCTDGQIVPADQWLLGGSNTGPVRRGLISREVNMRALPSLDGQVIEKLPGFGEVDVVSCQMTDDTQNVWYQVNHNGREGWVSARFVSPIFAQ